MPTSASPTPASTPPLAQSSAVKMNDLEIKDAQLIFNAAWHDLESDFGRENMRFPKEIILLGGAPGAGKGTNTQFIAKTRGLTCPPVVMSALLDSPEAKALKDAGSMVGDREVVALLLRELMKPMYRDGVILDGFPRTRVQVECLTLLVEKMHELRREFYGTPLGIHFRLPTIHIMVLFVDEKESVARQLKRGRESRLHNAEVQRTGVGSLVEERATDFDEALARRRYRVFKEQTWDALQSLKEIFHYHFVNAQGAIEEVEQNIIKELEYQSTLELDPRTVDRLRRVPVASDITIHARQELVKRLDGYEFGQPELLAKVVTFIEQKVVPIVLRHAISGVALINTEDPVLDDPLALAMLIDVFSERGYHAVVDLHRIEVPERFDLQTGAIKCRIKKVFRVQIRFPGSEIRRG
ncbi:nucleoside monophosphate kinase [Horticoccus luteus]|uniref:Adenylate kinase n=1 Tax=Horticoccus luteus TaxID=2862869 RepID=A0A8F9TXM0_9BACT|nr:nucleoside monophosphate kinase [Horticoccus luteus]QYM79412.1 nucleoside monophosphate kinase [Horticoccus luteus]